MTQSERKTFEQEVGTSAGKLAENLLNVFDEDVVNTKAMQEFQTTAAVMSRLSTM